MDQNSYAIHSFGRFLARRLIRIEIPYLTIIALEVVLILLSSGTTANNGLSERLNAYHILLNIGHLNDVAGRPWLLPVFWTLAIEIQFYLLMAISFPLFLQKKFLVRLVILSLLASSGFVFNQSYIFFNYSLPFLIGIVTFQVIKKIVDVREYIFWMFAFSLPMFIRQGPLPTLVTIATPCLILCPGFNWKYGSFLGMISYSVYLIHVPFGGRLLALTEILVSAEWIKTLLIFLFVILTIILAWVFYILVEVPSLQLSKKLSLKSKSMDGSTDIPLQT